MIFRTCLFSLLLVVFACNNLYSQPEPGDYFQEYIWKTSDVEGNSPFLRVGGKMGYRARPDQYPDSKLKDDKIFLLEEIDFKNAIRAEICVEKVLCHENTKNLGISLNGKKEYLFSESEFIPEPQDMYMHHFYPTVEIDLKDLQKGKENYFSLEVDSIQLWNWPQHLIYGLILRVYYEAPKDLNSTMVEVRQVDEGKMYLKLTEVPEGTDDIVYLAKYDGIDWDGDGNYHDWHYHYHRGDVMNHIASVTCGNTEMNWDISWIPDQKKAIEVAARVNFLNGKTYMTEKVDLNLKRSTYSVEFCKPFDQEQTWVTRNGERKAKFKLNGDPIKILEAKMHFTSWSPGYLNGIYLNDFLLFDREGPKYSYMQHSISIDYLEAFQKGENIIKTGKTPLHHGQMVHGTEIMWPGIMVLVKYKN